MARMTTNEKVAALPEKKREQIRAMIGNGKTIVEISEKLKLDYAVIQNFAWREDILSLPGAKNYISRRLRRFGGATRRNDREQLAVEIRDKVDYLYYVARHMSDQLSKVKKSVT